MYVLCGPAAGFTLQPGYFISALVVCSILWWRRKCHHCGKLPSVWWLDTWCAELGLWDGHYVCSLWPDGHSLVGEICATFGHKFPDGVLRTAHSSMCLSNEPCKYVQGIATHSCMHHPVTVKRSYVLKWIFERVICLIFLMLFMWIYVDFVQ